jgi:hypothetical protein
VNAILRWYLRKVLSRPIIRAIDWTPEERNAFDLFCKTSCGIKLFEFLRQLVANSTFNAVYGQDPVSQNARARGMQDLLAILYRLRVFPVTQEESSFESLADSEPQGSNVRNRADSWRPTGGRGAIG